MKGYLLLEDGSLFYGNIISSVKNVLGQMILDDQGGIALTCGSNGKQGLVVNSSDCTKGDVVLSDIDFKALKSRIEKNSKLQGKIVTDSLPIDFHVYDLKTYIPVGM